jgi:hypothetical protein
MEPEKLSNHVDEGERRKDDITSFSLEDGPNEIISGGGEKHPQGPVTETPELEIWNKPRINMYRYLATLYTFIIMGMNDAAYGVSLIFMHHLNSR